MEDELIAKYQIKELRVVLVRCDDILVSNYEAKNITEIKIEDQIEKSHVKDTFVDYDHSFTPFSVKKDGKTCSYCVMKYSEKKKLYDHLKLSMEDSLFRCEVCNIAFKRDPDIIIDLERDWNKRIKCEICHIIC
ncbi:uncharacterized protein LOC112591332 [Melanaphis sacchari]|uniref:uncharacterized protein LOC112591332 n=1 Tax=Melanaphis sacchari TaxID=742174 RepID=UPI000DC135E8|nr:uncharacterized protein LOC112591332 [Melanaphis sacchari]XP_025190900.1 uncharacterized protein LOC112591332 [Melanaphis sacchari]XP_025190901.1 uncharacterized protein LOC112591332 [Melanaphis sacchari]XP_025190903.1 uncharacterized protein LOC112591332 [Melanaphis sacchari]